VTDHPASPGGWSAGRAQDDDGWGPATPVRAGGRAPRGTIKAPKREQPVDQSAADPNEWFAAGPQPRRRSANARRGAATANGAPSAGSWAPPAPKERGLRWWAALLLLIAIAAVGGLIDTLGSDSARGGFNIGIVVASVVAILLVRRSHMFPVVIAPPIVYSAAAVLQLYLRSGGLHDKRVVFDAAANYLVYGFPAIASATAAVLIIAGIRLIARR
jgi:hypothetical protein